MWSLATQNGLTELCEFTRLQNSCKESKILFTLRAFNTGLNSMRIRNFAAVVPYSGTRIFYVKHRP